MSGFRLHISSATYTISDILHGSNDQSNVLAATAIRLCKEWFDGKEWFELKTSGSTGTPKTIEVHRSQIEASANASLLFFQLKESDSVVCPLSLGVIGGQMMLYRSIIGGLELSVLPADKSMSQLNTSASYDFIPVSAIQLHEVLQHHADKAAVLNSLKNLLIGGSSISEALLLLIRNQLRCTVWQSYGMTETVSHIAMRQIHPHTQEVYTVLPDIEIAVDTRSCLKIKGAVTQQQWLQTNDVVQLTDAQHFTFTGRADFTINSGGIKIQAEHIEKVIDTLFREWQVDTAFFVAGIPDEVLGEKLILVLENAAIDTEHQKKILAELVKRLPKYHAPKSIQIRSFCYTPSGKINRTETLKKAAY